NIIVSLTVEESQNFNPVSRLTLLYLFIYLIFVMIFRSLPINILKIKNSHHDKKKAATHIKPICLKLIQTTFNIIVSLTVEESQNFNPVSRLNILLIIIYLTFLIFNKKLETVHTTLKKGKNPMNKEYKSENKKLINYYKYK
ncbi:hypothetical protein NE302_12755, partial [Lactococcus lactis]